MKHRVGISGNVLINKDGDRVNSYNVWNYAEGQDSYYASMLVDLTLPPDEVSEWLRVCVVSRSVELRREVMHRLKINIICMIQYVKQIIKNKMNILAVHASSVWWMHLIGRQGKCIDDASRICVCGHDYIIDCSKLQNVRRCCSRSYRFCDSSYTRSAAENFSGVKSLHRPVLSLGLNLFCCVISSLLSNLTYHCRCRAFYTRLYGSFDWIKHCDLRGKQMSHCPWHPCLRTSVPVCVYACVQMITMFSPLTWGIYPNPPPDIPECGFVGELCPIPIRGEWYARSIRDEVLCLV